MKVLLKRYSLSPLDTDDVLQEAALASLLRMLESEIVDLQHFRRYVYDRTRGIVLDRLTRRREVTGNLDAGQLPAPEDQEASSHLTEVVHELRRRVKQLPDRQRNVIERIATGPQPELSPRNSAWRRRPCVLCSDLREQRSHVTCSSGRGSISELVRIPSRCKETS